MDRRLMLQGLMAVCGAGTLAACSGAEEKSMATPPSGSANFTDTHRKFLAKLSDVIIPQTDSPGALVAGASVKVEEVITNLLGDTERKKWLSGLTAVHAALDKSVGGDFMKASVANQTNAIQKLDKAAYNNGAAPKSYRALKSAIATAYYLSETGATEELRYEPVPGDWKACIPFSEIGRTWAV